MIKNALAYTAAALLTLAPIAAQAGTRAADASVSLAPMSRLGSPVGTAQSLRPDEDILWLIALLFGAGVGGIFVIESQEGDASPATGG